MPPDSPSASALASSTVSPRLQMSSAFFVELSSFSWPARAPKGAGLELDVERIAGLTSGRLAVGKGPNP